MSDTQDSVSLTFKSLGSNAVKANVAVVSLSRTTSANAFNAEMIRQLQSSFNEVKGNKDCRALILRGLGKHFSAGADLNWMKDSAKLSFEQNLDGSIVLQKMFESLHTLPIPTIALVQGAAYGGAVGLVAACDYAIGLSDVKFCLSEVKVGLIPAVILPYLQRKMRPSALNRLSLTGKVFNATEALNYGLIEKTCTTNELNDVLREEITSILAASPQAQASLKLLTQQLLNTSTSEQTKLTTNAIATIRQSKEGQAGLTAFFEKKTPPWNIDIGVDWTIDEEI